MSEDVGGTAFPDGDDHGGADEEFASVVFDEAFVRAASLHEPTAQERLLAAAQARAEADAARTRIVGADDQPEDLRSHDGSRPDGHRAGHPVRIGREAAGFPVVPGPYRYSRPYRVHGRWHRTVAWVLAVVMGVGVVALTFAAVYRGAGGGSRQPVPPPVNGRTDSPRPSGDVVSPVSR